MPSINLIGIISNYIPEEIVEYFGVPYRIIGKFCNLIGSYIPTFTCSFVKDLIINYNAGVFNNLSGLIVPHSCDSLYAAFDLFEKSEKFIYRFSTPIINTKKSTSYLFAQIKRLITFLEKYFSLTLEKDILKEIIKTRNRIKEILNKIGLLISIENRNIKYKEFLSLIIEAMQNRSQDIEEMLNEKYISFKEYETVCNIKNRVMIVGPIFDNFDILDAIEEKDYTKIIHDNITNGWRYINGKIPENLEPIKGITSYYINRIYSPTFYSNKYLEYINKSLKEFRINRVICINQKGCEPHSFYIPTILKLCKSEGISFLSLNIEHTELNIDKIKSQIESFLELS